MSDKKLIPDLDFQTILTTRVAELFTEWQMAPGDAAKMAVLSERGHELIELYQHVLDSKKIRSRASHVADMAASFCHTIVETTDDDDSLRQAAKRAVKLAHYLIAESERFHGLTPFKSD